MSDEERKCVEMDGCDSIQKPDGELMDVCDDDESRPSEQKETKSQCLAETELSTEAGKGVSLSNIRQGYGPWGPPPLPPVEASTCHNVLYKLPWRPGKPPDPFPNVPCDRWDQDHVRMPNSSESLYPVQEADDEKSLRLRWELVQEALLRPIVNSNQLEFAILSYNSRYNEKWNFRALHTLFNEVLEKEETLVFFNEVLPRMTTLALQLPELVTGPIPLLRKHRCQTLSLSQLQIGSLLANAFFCTFPRRNSTKRGSEYSAYPDINFNRLFQCGDVDSSSVLEKLKCILNYFRRICLSHPQGVVTFSRRCVAPQSFPTWSKSSKLLPKMHITSGGFIEQEGSGMLQVDFANKFIGGGVLGWGCVQEEIRFVICPELIVSRLFTECLDSTEALIIVGCERFSAYSGYGHTFEWLSDFVDETPLDSFGRRHCSIVAMDALYFSNPSSQFSLPNLLREVNKAYVGFRETEDSDGNTLAPVATGNWGCGAFRGDTHLKALLQLMAAGEAGRDLVYFTFGDKNLRDRIYGMYKFLMDNLITIGKLWKLVCQYSMKLSTAHGNVPDLYEFIYSTVLESTTSDEKVSELKPTLSLKRRGPSGKPKQDSSSNHPKADSSSCDLAGSGLTAEDFDSLIEEFDSDEEKTEEQMGRTEEAEFQKNTVSPTTSGSCLTLIEESLNSEKPSKKGDASDSSTNRPKLASSTLSTPAESNTCGPRESSASSRGLETVTKSSNEKKSVPSKDSKNIFHPIEQNSSVSDSKCEVASRNSSLSLKKTVAPKRKISEYFYPV